MFRNRSEAGFALAGEIASLLTGPVLVAAIPRGGVPVGRAVADRLGAPLTLLHLWKLVVWQAESFAVGAVDEDGHAVFDDVALQALRVDPRERDALQIRGAREICRQIGVCGGARLPRLLAPETELVLVDDVIATGWSMRAGLTCVRRRGARRVTVAAPCASEPAAEYFREHADRFLCPIVDEALHGGAEYYRDFSPVDDEQVRQLLIRPVPAGGGLTTAGPPC